MQYLNLSFFNFIAKPSAPVGPLQQSNLTEETVDLTWQPPRSDGGLSISSYIIEVREIHRNTWHMMCEVKSRYTTYTITGLVPGVQYLFRISAKNDEGQGPPLIGEQPVKPFKAACKYYM